MKLDEARWQRITQLFNHLLEVNEVALSAEPDPIIQAAAMELWRHHLEASVTDFLGGGIQFFRQKPPR